VTEDESINPWELYRRARRPPRTRFWHRTCRNGTGVADHAFGWILRNTRCCSELCRRLKLVLRLLREVWW